jgi:hypothetical protein
VQILLKSGSLKFLELSGLPKSVMGLLYLNIYIYIYTYTYTDDYETGKVVWPEDDAVRTEPVP